MDDSKGLETYFGSTRIVKGHDVQTEGANCNVALGGQPRLRARSGLFAANEMCRIDVGMSRCFNMYRGTDVPFTVLRLYEQAGWCTGTSWRSACSSGKTTSSGREQ